MGRGSRPTDGKEPFLTLAAGRTINPLPRKFGRHKGGHYRGSGLVLSGGHYRGRDGLKGKQEERGKGGRFFLSVEKGYECASDRKGATTP